MKINILEGRQVKYWELYILSCSHLSDFVCIERIELCPQYAQWHPT